MTVRLSDYEEYSYTLGRSYLSMGHNKDGWREGIFNHPEGLVRVFESYSPRHQVTSMFYIRDGRSHHRRWPTVWGDKTLARLARELVEDVVGV